MNLRHRQTADDNNITINEWLTLPDDQRQVLSWMQKRPACSFGAIVTFLQQSEESVRGLLDDLLQQGFIKPIAVGGETRYQVHLTSMRHQRHQKTSPSLFDALIDED
jgi:DNA-binding IclR family transcriptional regulator